MCARAKTLAMLQWRAAEADLPNRVTDNSPKHPAGSKHAGKIDYKTMFGPPPDVRPLKLLKAHFPEMGSGVLDSLIRDTRGDYRRKRIGILIGMTALPAWRNTCPIPVRDRACGVNRREDGGFSFWFNLYGKHVDNHRLTVPIASYSLPDAWRALLDEYADGTRTVPRVLIHCSDKGKRPKWFVDIPYDKPILDEAKKGRVLNVARPPDGNGFLQCRVTFPSGAPWIQDVEWTSVQHAFDGLTAKRIRIQHKYRCDGSVRSGRRGHGRKRAVEPFESITRRRGSVQRTFNHRRSKYIVEQAVRWKCGLLELEDLSQLDPKTLVMGKWPYFQLKTRIETLCVAAGIEFRSFTPVEIEAKRLAEALDAE